MSDTTAQFINGYKIIRHVARTGFSDVFEAEDPSGRRVCLKQLLYDSLSGGAQELLALKHEATQLAAIRHENVMQVIEFGEHEGRPFLVLEWIYGQTLAELVESKTLQPADVVEILLQVTAGIDAIHEKGIIHRDLKPANIMVDRKDDRFVAKIADFGLAGGRGESSKQFVGTLNYVAPEQAGLVDWPVEAQADLYSIGIILYECITGRCPFVHADSSALLSAHLSQKPEPPSTKVQGLQPLLERIILKLLEKEPANRYRSAKGLHFDLLEAGARIKRSDSNGDFALDTAVPSFERVRNVFVGRAAEVQKLNDLFQKAQRGQFSICLVSGVAGAGKSTLLREFENKSLIGGAKFAYGKCYEFSRALPYFCLSEAMTNLLKRLSVFPQSSREQIYSKIRDGVGDLDGELVQLVPAYSEIVPDAKPPKYAGEGKQQEATRELVLRLLRSISQKGSPLVIILDDLQWADRALLEMLARLSKLGIECPAMILGTYRSEEVDADHPLSKLLNSNSESLSHFDIGPLEPEDVRALNTRALGISESGHESLDNFVLEKAKGNPLFSIELLKALLGERILTVESSAVNFDLEKAETQKLPGSVVDMVLRRVNKLTDDQRQLVGHAALLGTAFTFEQLCKIVDIPSDQIHAVLMAMLKEQVLKLNRAKNYAFFHDKIHEACLGMVAPEKRPAIHLRFLEFLETQPLNDDVMFSLAAHSTRSKDEGRIVKYCSKAGEIALRRNANDDAYSYFAQADRILSNVNAEPEAVLELKMNLGECLSRLGRYEDARREFAIVREQSGGDKSRSAQARAKIAECFQREGKHEESKIELYAALEQLNFKIRRKNLWLPMLLDRIGVVFFTIMRRYGARSESRKKMDLAITGVLKRLWMVHVVNDTSVLTHISYRLLYVASKIGVSEELALAYQYLSFSLANNENPKIPLGLKYARRSVELARAVEAHETGAGSLVRISAYLTWQGRSTEVLEYSEKAREMLIALGNLWDVGNAIIFSYFAHRTLGFLDKAMATANALVKLAEQTGSKGMMASGRSKVAEVLFLLNRYEEGDEHIKAVFEITKANKLTFDYFQCLKVYGYANLYKNRFDDALKFFDKAVSIVDNSPRSILAAYRNDAYLGWCEAALRKGRTKDLSDEDKATIKKYLTNAEKTEKFYRDLGHVHRLNGWLEFLTGNAANGRKLFERATALFKEQERPIDMAIVDLDLGILTVHEDQAQGVQLIKRAMLAFGQRAAEVHVARCRTLLTDLGETVTEGQDALDRQKAEKLASALLEISVASVSSFDPLNQARALLDKTISLLKAERAILFTMNAEQKLEFQMGRNATKEDIPPSDGYSMTIVSRVVSTREPIVIAGTADGVLMGAHSIVSKNLLSMMAAPVLLNDQLIGVLYIDNKISAGIYKESDADFMMAIAKHIAVAIEVNRAAKTEVEKTKLEGELKAQIALAEVSKKVQVLADNMQQALFSVDSQSRIVEPVSKFSESVFGYDIANQSVLDVVYGKLPREGEQYSQLTTALSVVFGESSLQWDLMSDSIPTRVEFEEGESRRVFRVKPAPIWDNNENLERILFVVEDVAHLEELERQAKEQALRAKALQEMADVERGDLADFFEQFSELAADERSLGGEGITPDSINAIKRKMHTLKGNAGTMRLSQIAALIHESESKVIDTVGPWTKGSLEAGPAVEAIRATLVELHTQVDAHRATANRILRLDQESANAGRAELEQRVLGALATLKGRIPEREWNDIHAEVSKQFKFSVKSALQRYTTMLQELSVTLDKKVELVVAGDDYHVSEGFLRGLHECLVHLLRNAVDHGLERPEERVKSGKVESGKIEVRLSQKSGGLELIITDDGRGMNAEAIGAAYVAKGLGTAEEVAAMSADEKRALIFKPGFSSKQETTEISGRGVGLDAVLERIKQMNGRLELTSEMGRGSVFKLVFAAERSVSDESRVA